MDENNKKKKIERWKIIALYLLLYDVVFVNFSYFFGLWIRFDFRFNLIPRNYLDEYIKFAPIYTIFVIVIFYLLKLYNSVWRFISIGELNRIMLSSVITSIFHIAGITLLFGRMPISYYVVGMMVQFFFVVAIRFSYRFYVTLIRKRENDASASNVMIIGGGAAGQIIIKEMFNSGECKMIPRCIIDDDSNKWGRLVEGVPVVGGREDILMYAEKYNIDKIYVVMPAADAEQRREILNICKETNCELKVLPGVYQIVNGDVALSKMKSVAVEDLLGRDSIKVNMDEIFKYLTGKVILVTGGGGSIGSELCRQIAGHNPKQLIIFDVYENNAYDIEQELKKKYPQLNLVTLIGSVRDSRKVFQIFEKYRPQIVYHAAAHKHVPLMETSPCEAIKNNAIGTYKTAFAAMAHGCERFVLISTDKAVNPTNIMGASKRLCEMIIQSFDKMIKENKVDKIPQLFTHSLDYVKSDNVSNSINVTKTEFVAVRFGNVLGSNGSVIPLFKKQIEAGGPVTVTHPDIIRYFMTIPEAVSLVLQAGTYANGGEIFVLDMGEPVKIDTLARNLIRLSGYKPDIDIKIEYSGLRPGEKLYEEKLMAEEGMKKTDNDLIHIGCPIPFDETVFLEELEELMETAYKNKDSIRELVQKMVSTYHPAQNN